MKKKKMKAIIKRKTEMARIIYEDDYKLYGDTDLNKRYYNKWVILDSLCRELKIEYKKENYETNRDC